MKLGISTYSLHTAFAAGELTLKGVIETIADLGAEHAEIVPLGFNLIDNPELVNVILQTAADRGLELSNYAIGANFAGLEAAERRRELERVKREVDVCAALGIQRMRHDVASSPDLSIVHFLEELPQLAEACREIADYASGFGIITSVENHGYFIQHSDRVQALVHAVGRDNFRTTLDVGNFLCADENPLTAVASNLKLASMVHLKDFYIRPQNRHPGEGWFQSSGGNWLRGAIVGQGDIDMPRVLQLVKESGYDGYISIEFEGMEDCRKGTRLGLEYVKRTWNEI
ncbi:sugar phosphate isomerase/epimerase family protein [Paenibacillus jilunlii]|uniref:Sugar phosphate isomerase n=1 Tax=Paenibacillus jilunlii TaxID=682956 RepID=A0A1G9TQR8_9BACL|nr:sugar phosphate isomerase/epimerase family protein [Paenibacillus jilunlii]KWX71905.1 sugar phosphate isomerase [Paenibacillus jilunlii]SDM50139.1 Sugar phosphate isomerase/epimerase [Paenibacillus jilunlii]